MCPSLFTCFAKPQDKPPQRTSDKPKKSTVKPKKSSVKTNTTTSEKLYEDLIIVKTSKVVVIDSTEITTLKEFDDPTAIMKFNRFATWLTGEPISKKVNLTVIGRCQRQAGSGKLERFVQLVVRSVKDAQTLNAQLCKRNVVKLYKRELSLCYQVIKFNPCSGQSDTNWSPASGSGVADTLCGRLALIGTDSDERLVTLGGIVKKEGRLWVTTAKHTPPPHQQTPVDNDPEINPDDYDIEDLQPIILIQPPKKRAATGSANLTTPSKPTTTAEPIRLGPVKETDTGLECCLIPLDDHPELILPNQFRHKLGRPFRPLGEVAQAPRAGKVTVLAGASGQHSMTMLPSEVTFSLPSGKWATMWTLEPNDDEMEPGAKVPMRIRPGDSGSWVIDSVSGAIFGVVVACTYDTVYLLPLKCIFTLDPISHGWHDDVDSGLPLADEIVAARENGVAAAKRVEDARRYAEDVQAAVRKTLKVKRGLESALQEPHEKLPETVRLFQPVCAEIETTREKLDASCTKLDVTRKSIDTTVSTIKTVESEQDVLNASMSLHNAISEYRVLWTKTQEAARKVSEAMAAQEDARRRADTPQTERNPSRRKVDKRPPEEDTRKKANTSQHSTAKSYIPTQVSVPDDEDPPEESDLSRKMAAAKRALESSRQTTVRMEAQGIKTTGGRGTPTRELRQAGIPRAGREREGATNTSRLNSSSRLDPSSRAGAARARGNSVRPGTSGSGSSSPRAQASDKRRVDDLNRGTHIPRVSASKGEPALPATPQLEDLAPVHYQKANQSVAKLKSPPTLLFEVVTETTRQDVQVYRVDGSDTSQWPHYAPEVG